MNFPTIVSAILLGFLVKNTSCKTANNFDIDNMSSICSKKVIEVRKLAKSTEERVKKHKIEDELAEELKSFLESVGAAESKCKTLNESAKDEKEREKKLLAEPNKPSEEELSNSKRKSAKENNDKALDWVEAYHDVVILFFELDYRIVLEVGKKTSYKVVEEYVSNYEIKSSGFFTSFTSMAITIPFILVLSQII